ncbi:putative low-complexity protein [Xenococcus sp. PCC 7305]|uniref:pentapeptide repeat-containing protein n=1 Tax=Xenococcus sp. PCC 7305 TaxID=102125 RepID=UPI0002AC8C76|nr:pentapeptide repeat-containing protein [Xenococcus sp. PCC 7305]ELS02695.1 putative low-complexity protein [Xenococcus sp. PCC 7305]
MVICFPDPEIRKKSHHSNLAELPSKQPLGEILLEAGLISIFQIEVALAEQKQSDYRIGEILAHHGWIKQETADFFAQRWSNLIQKTQTRPLTYYLFAASLLDKKQLLSLKQQQKQQSSHMRLHELALEKGYVAQTTIDYFLKSLFKIHRSQSLSFTSSYKIIKGFINGKSDFRDSELTQAPLNGVRLQSVILDNSILRQANLNNSNLSYSSFSEVNLALANLEMANLSHANFRQACLIEANLRRSNLESANFQSANLQEADLRGANLLNASFASADLRGAKFSPAYSYDVYYDKNTAFDSNFNPIKAGWKLQKFLKISHYSQE